MRNFSPFISWNNKFSAKISTWFFSSLPSPSLNHPFLSRPFFHSLKLNKNELGSFVEKNGPHEKDRELKYVFERFNIILDLQEVFCDSICDLFYEMFQKSHLNKQQGNKSFEKLREKQTFAVRRVMSRKEDVRYFKLTVKSLKFTNILVFKTIYFSRISTPLWFLLFFILFYPD